MSEFTYTFIFVHFVSNQMYVFKNERAQTLYFEFIDENFEIFSHRFDAQQNINVLQHATL